MKLYELESKLNEVVLCIQEENYELRDRNDEKSGMIEKLRKELAQKLMHSRRKLSNESSKDMVMLHAGKPESEISTISAVVKIEHIESPKSNQQQSNTFYISKLESLIIKYEKII